MFISVLRQTLKSLKSKINFQKFVIIALLVILIILSSTFAIRDRDITLSPMGVTEKVKVSYSNADAAYFRPIAFTLVSQISLITPTTAAHWHRELEPFFDDKIWAWLGPQILQIENRPSVSSMSIFSFFEPNEKTIEYEPETNTFYITGKITSSTFNKNNQQVLASVLTTFEVRMHMVAGRPKAYFWRAYTGNPMTKAWVEKNPAAAEKREQEIKKQHALVLPVPKEGEIIYQEITTPEAPPKAGSEVTKEAALESSPTISGTEKNSKTDILEHGIKPPEKSAQTGIQSNDDPL